MAEEESTDTPDSWDKKESGEVDKGSKSRILLAVPLFCKFLIVLVIKLLTDLVVFPLLLLYRLGRRTKRRILKLFEKSESAGTSSDDSAPSETADEPAP